jgi:GH24 family phage-related lysozyme (muramidase)
MGDADLASASMEQLNQFQRQHPSAGAWAFDAADTLRNESLAERDVELSVEKQLDEAFLTSPTGAMAAQQTSAMEDPAAAQSYMANARAQYVANNFRTEELTRETQQYGVNEDRRTEMWTLAAFDLKAGANIINTAYTDAVEALVLDPTKTIAFDEIEGLVAELPQLAGTVMTRENAPQVLQKVRDAYAESQTQRIAQARGLQPGELGVMPEAVANSVFASLDATISWSEKQLDPAEIKRRLENTTFNQMVEAGVPLDVISSISLATAGNPALQAQAMGALTEGTGAVMELYNGAEFEAARKANRDLSAAERTRAFAGFSELARVWGGTSSVASVYEEVNETERALKFGSATVAALDTVMTEAETQGTPARLGQNFYRQNIEQVATQFDAAIAASPSFKPEVVKHLSSDLNVHFLDVNQTANDQGYQISVGDNDKLVFIPTEENLLEVQEIEAEIAALESGERGNPRDFRGMIDGYKKQLEVLQTPPDLPLNDLQYKWTVLNGLGEVGSEVRQRASAEFSLELAADVAADTREALASGGAGTVADLEPSAVIAEFEGFSKTAYWDVNAWRTGFGSDTVTRADGSIEKVTEDTVVTREDAERDLARRTVEFSDTASRNVGAEVWEALPANVKSALTSVAYNYGNIPSRIRGAVRSGDVEAIAAAVEGLAGDNEGVNENRRMREAAIIRGGAGIPRVDVTPLEPAPEADPDAPTRLAPETSARPTARGGSGGSESAPTTSARPEARPTTQTGGSIPFERIKEAVASEETTPAMLAEIEALVKSIKERQ